MCSQKAKVKRVVMAVLLNRQGNLFLIHAQMGVDKMTEGWVEAGYTSLHRCIKNIQRLSSSHRRPGEYWQDFLTTEKEYPVHTELSRTKERRDKEEGKRRSRASGTSLHLGEKELKRRGEIPTSMAIHWDGGGI